MSLEFHIPHEVFGHKFEPLAVEVGFTDTMLRVVLADGRRLHARLQRSGDRRLQPLCGDPVTGAGRDARDDVRYFPKNLGARFSRNARMPS